ncbi:hypothetical protein F4779DRAFT_562917 [Xylariaceae sp. FL0662B]|nr:hypothetical protein F4779DRAFT_562917 [Xylariaceae sp. FL0662B]
MSSSDSACPEDANSTDCLLRSLFALLDDAIQEKDAETNWDPITFAFTVPVGLFGICAAVFALVTIYQAVLAAGPGRRKCIAQAIGPWSKLNTRKWSWTELRWYYQARTPVLDQRMVHLILNGADQPYEPAELGEEKPGYQAANTNTNKITNRPWGIIEGLKRTLRQSDGNSSNEGKPGKPFQEENDAAYDMFKTNSASWIGFLDKCGLSRPNPSTQPWITRVTDVDTLPDDLPAVPAYAEVGCIITLSGATGARYMRIDTQSGLNTGIVGSDFQFDFRNHPILGLIGAFSKRHKPGNQRTWPSRKHMLATLHHSRGGFKALAGGHLYDSNVLKNPQAGFITDFLCTRCADSQVCQARSLFDSRDRHKLLWLLAGACPDIVMPIFPFSMVGAPNLDAFALQTRFWAAPISRNSIYELLGILSCPQLSVRIVNEEKSFEDGLVETAYSEEAVTYSEEREEEFSKTRHLTLQDSDDEICILSTIWEGCLIFLNAYKTFRGWFYELGWPERRLFRAKVHYQLRQIDSWLAKQDQKLVNCRQVCLYMTAVALLDTAKAMINNQLGSPPTTDTSKVRTTQGVAYRNFSILNYLRWSMQIKQDSTTTEPVGDSTREIQWFIQTHPFFFRCWQAEEHDAKLLISRVTDVVEMCYGVVEGVTPGISCDADPEVGSQSSTDSSIDGSNQPPEQIVNKQQSEEEKEDKDVNGDVDKIDKSCPPKSDPGDVDSNSTQSNATGTSSYGANFVGGNTTKGNAADEQVPDGAYSSGTSTTYTSEECLDNILIWRTIVLAMLFYTTENNGEIMASGRWDHVIPIL